MEMQVDERILTPFSPKFSPGAIGNAHLLLQDRSYHPPSPKKGAKGNLADNSWLGGCTEPQGSRETCRKNRARHAARVPLQRVGRYLSARDSIGTQVHTKGLVDRDRGARSG